MNKLDEGALFSLAESVCPKIWLTVLEVTDMNTFGFQGDIGFLSRR